MKIIIPFLLCTLAAVSQAQLQPAQLSMPSAVLSVNKDKPRIIHMVPATPFNYSQPNYLPYRFEFFSNRALVNQGLSQTLQMADPALRPVNSCFTPSGGFGAYNMLAPKRETGIEVWSSQ